MSAQHTPGPWRPGMAATDRAIYGPKGEHIATLPDMLPRDEVLQNMRLIEAAPDMLQALRELVNAHDLEMGPRAVELRIYHARAAIAKATRTP